MSDRQKRDRSAVGGYASHDMRLIGTPHDRGAGNRADQLCAFADALQRSQAP